MLLMELALLVCEITGERLGLIGLSCRAASLEVCGRSLDSLSCDSSSSTWEAYLLRLEPTFPISGESSTAMQVYLRFTLFRAANLPTICLHPSLLMSVISFISNVCCDAWRIVALLAPLGPELNSETVRPKSLPKILLCLRPIVENFLFGWALIGFLVLCRDLTESGLWESADLLGLSSVQKLVSDPERGDFSDTTTSRAVSEGLRAFYSAG